MIRIKKAIKKFIREIKVRAITQAINILEAVRFRIQFGLLKYEPQSDQSGLLSPLEIRVALNEASRKSPTIPLSYHYAVAKAQRDLTASIKDAEWEKKLEEAVAAKSIIFAQASDRAAQAHIEALIETERKRIGETILSMAENAPKGHKLAQIENWCKFHLKATGKGEEE